MSADGQIEVRVRVTSAPEGGKATAAVCKTVAKSIGIAKSKVAVKRGETSRHKLLEVECPQEVFDAWLKTLDTSA